jgi:hypothetical protein
MPSSGMLSRVPLVRTDVLEERSTSIIRMTKSGELATLAVPSNLRARIGSIIMVTIGDIVFHRSMLRLLDTAIVVGSSPILVTLMMDAIRSSETSA